MRIYPIGWVMPPHHKNSLFSDTHLLSVSFHQYSTNGSQINQVAKHPAIFCHDVCVIGWFKKEAMVRFKKISNLNYKVIYKNSCAVFYHITPLNLQQFVGGVSIRYKAKIMDRKIKKSDTFVSLFYFWL